MEHNGEFEKLIKKDRDLHQTRSWRGNLLGYLEKVKCQNDNCLKHTEIMDFIKAG